MLSIEGNSPTPLFVRVDAYRFKGSAISQIRLDQARKFVLTAVHAGEITLSAFPSLRHRFYVKSIEANGLDLLRTNLTIGEGEEIKNVSIVISPNVGLIAGRVLSLKGVKPIVGINVSSSLTYQEQVGVRKITIATLFPNALSPYGARGLGNVGLNVSCPILVPS